MPTRGPLIGRERQIYSPPWPWQLEAGEILPGLLYPGSHRHPPDGICDWLAGVDWTLSGSIDGSFNAGGDPYSVNWSFSGVQGQSGTQTFYNIDDDEYTVTGTPYPALENISELGVVSPSFGPIDPGLYSLHLVAGGAAASGAFIAGAYVAVGFPRLVFFEGSPAWNLPIVGRLVLDSTDVETYTSEGLDFIDADIASNSGQITAHSSGFDLVLTATRAG